MWPGTWVTSTEILVMLLFTSGDTTKISGSGQIDFGEDDFPAIWPVTD